MVAGNFPLAAAANSFGGKVWRLGLSRRGRGAPLRYTSGIECMPVILVAEVYVVVELAARGDSDPLSIPPTMYLPTITQRQPTFIPPWPLLDSFYLPIK